MWQTITLVQSSLNSFKLNTRAEDFYVGTVVGMEWEEKNFYFL